MYSKISNIYIYILYMYVFQNTTFFNNAVFMFIKFEKCKNLQIVMYRY